MHIRDPYMKYRNKMHVIKINYEDGPNFIYQTEGSIDKNWFSQTFSPYLLQVTLTDSAFPAQHQSRSMAVSELSST